MFAWNVLIGNWRQGKDFKHIFSRSNSYAYTKETLFDNWLFQLM